MKYQALFFDFDGVLADSFEVKTRAFAKLYRPYGSDVVTRVVDHHRCHGGVNRVDKFHYYHRKFLGRLLREEELNNLCDQFAKLVVKGVISATEILGAEAFLRKWAHNVPCFVVSATPEDEIREIVKCRGMKKYFRAILGAPATKQDNLDKLIDEFRLYSEQCLFFGDSESDYRTATKCGIKFLGVVPGPDAPLLEVISDVHWVKDFIEVEKWLEDDHV